MTPVTMGVMPGSLAGLRHVAGNLRVRADVVERADQDRHYDRARSGSAFRGLGVVMALTGGYRPDDQPDDQDHHADAHKDLRFVKDAP